MRLVTCDLPGALVSQALPREVLDHEPLSGGLVRTRRGVRVVDGACLESMCTEMYRGFEPRPLRS